jgi:hypothetical protein
MLPNFFVILFMLPLAMLTPMISTTSIPYFIEHISYNDPAAVFIRQGGGGSMEVDWNDVRRNQSPVLHFSISFYK